MKKSQRLIRFSFLFTILFSYCLVAIAQNQGPRKSPKATVSQQIGVDTDVVIDYSRPAVNERKIWGELVVYGMNAGNEYSKNNPYPWRAGANENTTITISKDVKVEGKTLPAGKYGLHMLPGENEFKIMFNKVNDSWGSYAYDASKNALEISVKTKACDQTEWLEFGFTKVSDVGAVAHLRWDKLEIPFKIEAAK